MEAEEWGNKETKRINGELKEGKITREEWFRLFRQIDQDVRGFVKEEERGRV